MKVLVDTAVLRRPAAGTQRYVTRLLEAFARMPDSPHVLRSDGLPLLPRRNVLTKTGNFVIEQLRLNVVVPLEAGVGGADLVHWTSNTMSRTARRPQVVTIHDLNFLAAPGTYDPAFARYARSAFLHGARNADLVIAVSEWTRAQVIEHAATDPRRVVVVRNGVDIPQAEPETSREGHCVLYVGAFEPHKDVPTLIRAFDRVANNDPRLQLVLAGRTGRDLPAIRATIEDCRARDRVQIVLDPSDRDLHASYERARVFAFPSRAEGFGFPPLEAMARGTPVIASRAGALPEILGDAALWFEPGEADELAACLEQLLQDETLRLEMAARGLTQVKRYSWDATARGTVQVYGDVLARRS